VLYDSVDMGELLLAAGADKEARNRDGRTVLHETVRRGLVKVGTWLLQKGANPSTRDNQGRTPLFDAVQAPSPSFVQLLLQSGAAVNARDDSGSTVLHLAASLPPAMTGQLLAAGADPFAENASGTTPAVLALKGSPDVWKVFFSAKNVNAQNNQGNTALHLGVQSGISVAATQYLISLGADLRIRDKDGKTAGDLASTANRTDLATLLQSK
jgi:ankyrin repeat protein